MRIAVVLFTRDLRVHDHPALAAACKEADKVVPLFVFDDDIWTSDYARPNRTAFLLESLSDLAASLTERGAGLVVRRGELVEETLGAASDAHAEGIFLSADASAFATRRWVRLKRACEGTGIHLRSFPGTSGVSPGDVTPSNGDHFRVFTPYYRRWKEAPRRALSTVPG
nr:deoxyribodipyrimidine photo-lyase [Actinomycetota bacterium]